MTGNVLSARILWIRKVQRLAILTAINFGIRAPSLFDVSAVSFKHVGGIKPALKMSAARLALIIFFVAGALSGGFDLNFMIRKLLGNLRFGSCHFARCQWNLSWTARGRRNQLGTFSFYRTILIRTTLVYDAHNLRGTAG